MVVFIIHEKLQSIFFLFFLFLLQKFLVNLVIFGLHIIVHLSQFFLLFIILLFFFFLLVGLLLNPNSEVSDGLPLAFQLFLLVEDNFFELLFQFLACKWRKNLTLPWVDYLLPRFWKLSKPDCCWKASKYRCLWGDS